MTCPHDQSTLRELAYEAVGHPLVVGETLAERKDIHA